MSTNNTGKYEISMSQATPTYNFPLLRTDELVANFNDYEIDLTDTDFKNPKRERWERHYVNMVALATDNQVGDIERSLQQINIKCADKLEYNELHQDAIPLFNLTSIMRRVMFACAVEDFKLSDIIEPKTNRLLKICSAMMNFLLFQSSRLEVYHRLRSENEIIIQQRSALETENDDLQSRISAIRAQKVEKEPVIKQLQNGVLEKGVELERLHRRGTELKKQDAELKTKRSEKKAYYGRLNEHIAGLKEESNRLSSQIVVSPDRMKKEEERMKAHLSQIAHAGQEKRNKLLDYTVTKKENLSQIQTDCDQALGLIQTIAENKTKIRDVSTEIRLANDEIIATKDSVKDLSFQEQHLKRTMSTKTEKLHKLTLQQTNKITTLQEEMAQLEHERETMLDKQSEDERELNVIHVEREGRQQDLNDLLKRHENTMKVMREKHESLIKQVDEYHANLSDALEQCKMTLSS